ncbi:MAG: hypothetical protein E6K41_01940 [Gammaproteobacteria bacterium]|nr:MAG: hypothetical protein E6K41_01940 [Gammaproteobacteria bacterium]
MNAARGRHILMQRTARAAPLPRRAAFVLTAALVTALAACSGGGSVNIANSQRGDPATVDFPIFYVKRTVPKNAAGVVQQDDLRVLRDAVPSADLFMRATASPSATETNITARLTAGASWDVKDVDTSADGAKVVFAMRGPLAMNQDPKQPPSWRIYEYVIATNTLHPLIDPATDPDPLTVNDVSPHYLPDGRILFSTTRQSQSKGILTDEGKQQFEAQDEDRNESAFVLEVYNPNGLNADGTRMHQISFNQSHDRDATVLANGRVLWSRWDHAPGKDAMHLYSANPDGTDLELYYGANSHMTGTNNTVVEFVQPRQMQDGRILALERQYTGVDFGGNLVIIDGAHYAENTQPLAANSSLTGPAQTPATTTSVQTIPGPSPGGRFNSGYPLQDGTSRILVSWSQCRLIDNTQTPPAIVPCTSNALAQPNVQAAPPLYSVWMFDPVQNTLMPLMQPVEGIMVTDVAVAQPHPLPAVILDKVAGVDLDQNLVKDVVGVIDIRSVYDIDGMDTANPNIPTVADSAKTPPGQRPARFIRLEKAVSIPDRTIVNLSPAAFGASDYMLEIMGYAPIEPDGSVQIEVPANVAFRVSVLDANARRIGSAQGVWLQVKPGEVVKCNGCHQPAAAQNVPACTTPGQVCPTAHSHGRQGLFASAWAGAAVGGVPFPHTIAAGPGAFIPQAGETMGEARMRVSCANDNPPCKQMVPGVNVTYTDVWTDPAQTPNVGAPINAGCHNPTNAAGAAQTPAGNLDLTNSASTDVPQEFTSYRQLLFPHNTVIMGQPGPTVGPYMNAGSANGGASKAFFSCFATGSGCNNPSHTGWLNIAELRLLSEWLDIGAQYFNNPFDPAVPVN